jgi:hypothetical protein
MLSAAMLAVRRITKADVSRSLTFRETDSAPQPGQLRLYSRDIKY